MLSGYNENEINEMRKWNFAFSSCFMILWRNIFCKNFILNILMSFKINSCRKFNLNLSNFSLLMQKFNLFSFSSWIFMDLLISTSERDFPSLVFSFHLEFSLMSETFHQHQNELRQFFMNFFLTHSRERCT